MNRPSLSGFRTSLISKINVSDREINRQNKRKNHRAELSKMIALEALILLDDYTERAKGDDL